MKKNLTKFVLIISFTILLPVIAFAQFVGPCPEGTYNNGTACVSASGIGGFLRTIQGLLNFILPVLLALGVVYFVWGVVRYVISDSEEVKKKGKDQMIYGLIGFVVIIGLWGLVYIVTDTFGLEAGAPTNDIQNLLP